MSRHESPPSERHVVDFEPFCLDLRSGQLLRGSTPVPLRPKTWGVLRYLAQRPQVLVTKHELLDAVWADVAVTESVLSKSIGELRVALGDSFRSPRLIETVQRRGFRFIAPLTGAASQPALPTSTWRPPFVGRVEELRQLKELFAKAGRSERQLALITGPAGIGKTALVEAFLSSPELHKTGQPLWIAHGGCVEQHGSHEPYLPVLEAMERLLRQPEAKQLQQDLGRCAPTWLAQMPWLLNEDEHWALRQSIQTVRPGRMLRELAVLIETWTVDATLILVIEDLHWSDPSSLDLLSMLGQRREAARLLVIGTYRPADAVVHAHHVIKATRRLLAQRHGVELPLYDLSEAAVGNYLQVRFGGTALPRALAQRVYAHTEGNPLFMTAVVDHLVARGDVVHATAGWELRAPIETLDLGIPNDVQVLIETQFYDIPDADRSLLEAASVAGDTFTALVVAAALGRDLTEIETRCEALVRTQRFLRVAGQVEWPDRSVSRRYAFLHEMYRRSVYTAIPDGLCMRLHQRIGAALEDAYGSRQLEIAPQLATHFQRGRDPGRALRYLTAAAHGAAQRFAAREVIGYADAALALVALLPEDHQGARLELELRLVLGPALLDINGFASDRVRENYERAAQLCTEFGDAPQLIRVLYARWYFHSIRGDREEAILLTAQVAQLARQLRASEYRLLAASVGIRTALFDGRFAESVAIMDRHRQSKANSHDKRHRILEGPDLVTVARINSATARWFLGYPDRARAICRESVAHAEGSGHAFTLSTALVYATLNELLCGHAVDGKAFAERCIAVTVEEGFAYWHAVASILRGWALIQQGQPAQGIDEIERTLNPLSATGARFFSTFAHAFLAAGHLQLRSKAAGLEAAEEGLQMAQSTLDRAYEPELWRLKGELLLLAPGVESRRSGSTRRPRKARSGVEPDWPEAERCLQHALGLARKARAKSLELRAATSLARAWSAHRNGTEARSMLLSICKWFPARATSADLTAARALLKQLA